MSRSKPERILSHLSDDQFAERKAVVDKLCARVKLTPEDSSRGSNSIVLLLGAPRVGKSEILRKCFDRLFNEGGEALPFFYALRRSCLAPQEFARDCFARFLAQFVAFRCNDPKLVNAADEQLAVISRAAPSADYLWVRSMVESFVRVSQSETANSAMRIALTFPALAAAQTGLASLVMFDDCHLVEGTHLQQEFNRALIAGAELNHSTSCLLTGLRRRLAELIPPDQDLFNRIELVHVDSITGEFLEKLARGRAESLGIESTDSTIELMVQQLNRDVFYTGAILDAAASQESSLKTFIEFERLYTSEALNGRIGTYLSAVLRDVAPQSRDRRAAVEALALVIEAGGPVPVDAVVERMSEHSSDRVELLGRLHAHELLEVSYGYVKPSEDPVLRDYVRASYRNEIAGASRPVAGDLLLAEKLKHSYQLMLSRFNRGMDAQLIELLSRFDFQNVPASLFTHDAYDQQYRAMSRLQVRRAIDDEQERLRLPQIVLVDDLGGGEQPGITWRLFAAAGFEGGIYTEANEVQWVVSLINSKEPLDVETLGRIDQNLETELRGHRGKSGTIAQSIRWYISKEGFSAVALERISSSHAYHSTYVHIDLLQDYLTRLALGDEPRPVSEFELVIPVEDEAELIAARTAEQIARAAEFDQESINQIKTALIEACINAAEHGDSPDRKIHQRFAIDGDKLIITVSNKGKTFGRTNGQPTPSVEAHPAKGTRGRGLQIIRALMDEVEFERTDDGARLVMTKYLKRPSSQ